MLARMLHCTIRHLSAEKIMAPKLTSPGRDLRIDFFRGIALMMIFVNHLPASPLSFFTLRNWGLSDSAEVFVLLAGLAAALAYGRIFEQQAFMAGVRAVFARMRKLYVVHLVLFVVIGYLCVLGAQGLGDSTYLMVLGYETFLSDPLRYLPDALYLMFQPGLLDILPLYVLLIGSVPLWVLLARAWRYLPLVVSLGIYAATQFYPLHLPNTVRDGSVWFFNPLAWQALFVIGFTIGQGMRRESLRGAEPARRMPVKLRHLITALALFYVALGVLVVGPWREIAGWENVALVDPNLLAIASKSLLHPLRLLDTLAKLWLVAVLIRPAAAWLSSMPARAVIAMGRHSLPVFALSTVLAVGGGILIEALPELPLSAAVNATGLGMMLMVGVWNEHRRTREKPATALAAQPRTVPLAG
jgi:hypothetical protein